MKKIFTLLFAVGMVAAAQAQPGNRDTRQADQRNWNNDDESFISINVSFDNDNRFGNGRYSNERKRNMEIAKINREYDRRIQKVKNSYFMSRFEKQRKINFLQQQRQQEIRMVYAKFNKRNQHDNRYDRNDRNNRRF